MAKIRYRWSGPPTEGPMIGGYLLSESPRRRGGYLIVGVRDRSTRGGLGVPVYRLFVLMVERVTVAEAQQGPTWYIRWDSRKKRRR